jgi:transcriptional regulator with XRE-family HTH domain
MEAMMSTKADNLSTRVAQAVKQRRDQLKLTLRDLSARSGVSASTISDIERGAKSPTIATLAALTQAMGLPMSAFTDNPAAVASRIHVVRAAERPRLVDAKSGARRDSFGPTLPGSKVEFLSYVVPPRKVAGPFAAHAGGTIEHMHVAAGSIRAEFGNEAVTLESGDSCTCYADAVHRFDNRAGKVEALIYIVVEQASPG